MHSKGQCDNDTGEERAKHIPSAKQINYCGFPDATTVGWDPDPTNLGLSR